MREPERGASSRLRTAAFRPRPRRGLRPGISAQSEACPGQPAAPGPGAGARRGLTGRGPCAPAGIPTQVWPCPPPAPRLPHGPVLLSQLSCHETLGGGVYQFVAASKSVSVRPSSVLSASFFAKQKGRGKKRRISVSLVYFGFVKKHRSIVSLVEALFFPKGLCPAPLQSVK